MNNLSYGFIGVIVLLAMLLFIQHQELEKNEVTIDTYQVKEKLAEQKAKEVSTATQNANKVAMEQLTKANKDTQAIMQQSVSADCQEAIKWAVQKAKELNQ